MTSDTSLPILDSHVHLFPKSHAGRLAWTENLPPEHYLNGPHSVGEYRATTASVSGSLLGFIFIEADRKVGLEEENWVNALDELEFACRMVKGTPKAGEDHEPGDSELLLGYVPWAPLPAGPKVLEKYVAELGKRCSQSGVDGDFVKGFRYLLQNKPAGFALGDSFIQSLLWLGKKGYTYDLGVDSHSGGEHELPEACQMLEKVYYAGGSKLKVIINHFCKPNLSLSPDEAASHPDLVKWSEHIQKLASYPRTYMKLSGLFDELPTQEEDAPIPIEELVKRTKPWSDVVFKAFGPSRIMFGSNWPICTGNGPGPDKSWSHWREVACALVSTYQLSSKDQARIWGGTAAEAYGVPLMDL